MTRTRRARRLPGHWESTEPPAPTRWRLPKLSDSDREEIRAARAQVEGAPAAPDAEGESA